MNDNKKLPGNPSLPSPDPEIEALGLAADDGEKYLVTDFFTRPEKTGFELSPDGKNMIFRRRNPAGKSDLWIQDLATGAQELLVHEGENVIRGYDFVADDTVIFTQDNGGDENYHIFAVNVSQKTPKDLTPFENVRAQVLDTQKADKNHIIISMNRPDATLFTPYRLNFYTGALEKLFDNPPDPKPIVDFSFDKNGALRVISRLVDGQNQDLYYFSGGEQKFLKHVPFGEIFQVLAFDYATPDAAYVLSNEHSDRAKIFHYDLAKNTYGEEIFAHETFDAGGISRSWARDFEIDYIFYNGEKPTKIFRSATFSAWMDALSQHLGSDADISVISRSDDEKKLVIFVSNDTEPGVFYLFMPEENRLILLEKTRPHLDRNDLAHEIPIVFTARDGLIVHGYFTRPRHAKAPVPVIVKVHGGPQMIRDSFGFLPENQLFASRGWGVLRVNFRISGGYGKAFFNAGVGQIGRAAMDDVEDGVAYVISKGWADPKKIAIYGGSHGGFAVLRGLCKTPDLYCAGVDYVGVANLFTFMQSIPAYWEVMRKMLYKIWYDPTDPESEKIMREVSPLQNADKIKKPLFVVQGANDPRVNINESDQIVQNLRDRGVKVPYLVRYDEGHGFAKEANVLTMQRAMIGFFKEIFSRA